MNPLDEIIDSILEELELERTLGVRSFEFDRDLLKEWGTGNGKRETGKRERETGKRERETVLDFAFLHHAPLTEKAALIIEKATAALGKTPQTAPLVYEEPRPAARVYVILGGLALNKWCPDVKVVPGTWTTLDGVQALVTYSPEFILRFNSGSPELNRVKTEFWKSLKTAAARAAAERKS